MPAVLAHRAGEVSLGPLPRADLGEHDGIVASRTATVIRRTMVATWEGDVPIWRDVAAAR